MMQQGHRRRPLLWLVVLGLLSLQGCKEKKRLRKDENLQAVVAADRKLMEEEKQILKRRGSLQRERTKIRDKRAALIMKKAALTETDETQRIVLEQEESKLASLEASLIHQEIKLNKKLQSLLDQKNGLVKHLSDDKSSSTREVLVARREYSIALREKDLSRRENELARREKALAAREQAFAVRQANMCPKQSSQVQVIHTTAPRSSGRSYSRKDVEPVFKAALRTMRTKGILTADLPTGVDRLVTETRHGVAKGDYVRAKYAADQLLATVRKMKIDRSFIGAKISRLSSAIRRVKPSRDKKAQVDRLFQKATANYGDGRFAAANGKLNRIYALLR